MALPPAAVAQLGALFNAALAGEVVTRADLANAVAPLATSAQVAAQFAGLPTLAQFNALAAQVAGLPTLAQFNALAAQVAAQPTLAQFNALVAQVAAQPTLAQIQALLTATLAPHNAPLIAATATATMQAIVAARAHNAHDRSGVAYAVVPLADGTPPPSWPAGFERSDLVSGPVAAIDALLGDYALPHGAPATLIARRDALALHIGTTRV
jgi:hypothetical protein